MNMSTAINSQRGVLQMINSAKLCEKAADAYGSFLQHMNGQYWISAIYCVFINHFFNINTYDH